MNLNESSFEKGKGATLGQQNRADSDTEMDIGNRRRNFDLSFEEDNNSSVNSDNVQNEIRVRPNLSDEGNNSNLTTEEETSSETEEQDAITKGRIKSNKFNLELPILESTKNLKSVSSKNLQTLESKFKSKKCRKWTRSEIMNKKLECFQPEKSSFKPLSNYVKSKNMFSSRGNYLKGMKNAFRSKKHERMTLVTFLSIFIYAFLPMNFLYSKINKFLPIFTIYLWLMSLWFFFLVRRQDPGIVPRLEILEGIRRIWQWRFQDKIKLISGFEEGTSENITESERSLQK
jgi:hypothetical protein